MNKDWKWQAGFVVGAIGCVELVNRLFQSATLTLIIATLQIAVPTLNLLFGEKAAESGVPWTSTILKRLLNVTRPFKFATLLVCILLIGLSCYAGMLSWRESHLLTITGYVEEADGSIAPNASVSLTIGSNRQTILATNGKFCFSKIDVQGKRRSDVGVIEAEWNGKKASKRVDLTSRDLTNEIIRLPLGHPPFRVQYYLLGGHAVDFFLKGSIDERWEKQLAGQPYIVPNSTFKTLSTAVTTFSEPFRGRRLLTPDYVKRTHSGQEYSQEAEDSAEKLADKFANMPMFVGTDASVAESLGASASRDDIESLSNSNSGWHATSSPYGDGPPGVNRLIFWRFCTPSDLRRFSNDRFTPRLVSWLQNVTKDYFPKDFCIVSMNGIECAEYHQEIAIGIRAVHLRIAVIENISSQSIHLGSFAVRENALDRLRTREEDQIQLKQQEVRSYRWFPPEDLKPGEKIAVPLEITFGYDKDKHWDLYHLQKDSDPDALNDVRDQLLHQNAVTLRYYSGRQLAEVNVSSNFIVRLIDQPRTTFGLDTEYIYGPSIRLGSLEVDDAEYPVRQFDPHEVVIRNGDATGSCPFVYTLSSRDNTWISEGRILYGADGQQKESADSVKLSRFGGSVLIREEEPERSFFRTIYISVKSPSGGRRIYYPTNWKALSHNGRYVELRQGHFVELRFALRPADAGEDMRLVAKGFYKPY